jgi:hypothetical protein
VSVRSAILEHMFDRVSSEGHEAALVERIATLESEKSAAAAEQAVLTAELDRVRRAAEAAAGVPAAKRGKGLASEIALARRDSPNRGGRHLGFAKALVYEMPHTLAALKAGALSEWRATLIVRESACLDLAHRRLLDARMCADQHALDGKGDKRIEADAKAIAYALDPHAVIDRAVRAESERAVWVRPAPDAMSYVTALLPMAKGVSVYAALKRAADTSDGRSRGQVMADTLVERITGRPAEVPIPVAVELVITDEALLGGDTTAARVPGYGPIPAAIACRLAADAIGDARSKATLRRLYRHPASGALVARESRARLFPKGTGPLHRDPRRHLPHPLLRRPHPPHRPRHPPRPRRPDQPDQRPRGMRSLQLRQASPRLASPHLVRRTRTPHRRIHHPDRQPPPITSTTTAR